MCQRKSLFLVCLGILFLSLLQLRDACAAYATSDCAGTWEFNSLFSGPSAPMWQRCSLTVNVDGTYSGLATDNSGGEPYLVSDVFTVTPDGVITGAGSGWFRGALDANKTVIAATNTFEYGSAQLAIGIKKAGSYNLADLVGTWEFNSLATGLGVEWWGRWRIIVGPDGSFTGNSTFSNGGGGACSGTLHVLPDGVVTGWGSSVFRGVMDAGKTVIVATDTWPDGATELRVGVKMAGNYGLADLRGVWELNAIDSGTLGPWWDRARITVAVDGSFAGVISENDGDTGEISGNIGISPDGTITWGGSVDAGKSVLVMTATQGAGPAEIRVGVRMHVPPLVSVPSEIPSAFSLDPVHPNPTSGALLTVHFALPSDAPAALDLLDVAGRRIATHQVGSLGSGRHTVDLAEGTHLAPGLYLVRLAQGSSQRVVRVAVIW
jgi:hypothetical protein